MPKCRCILEILFILNNNSFSVTEQDISTFDLTQSEEIFGSNVIQGLFSVSKYRRKEYSNNLSKQIIKLLNDNIN